MSHRKDIIRVGDHVKIINPKLFIRCGYPMTFDDAVKEVTDKYSQDILNLIQKVEQRDSFNFKFKYVDAVIYPQETREFKKIARALAYIVLGQNRFGGRDRKIYTEENIIVKDLIGKVVNIFFCSTGRYYPPSSGGGYSEEYEYESGGLENQKVHKIIQIQAIDYSWIEKQYDRENTITIEACNVEKVKDNHIYKKEKSQWDKLTNGD